MVSGRGWGVGELVVGVEFEVEGWGGRVLRLEPATGRGGITRCGASRKEGLGMAEDEEVAGELGEFHLGWRTALMSAFGLDV